MSLGVLARRSNQSLGAHLGVVARWSDPTCQKSLALRTTAVVHFLR